jgi:four helix bundle protein
MQIRGKPGGHAGCNCGGMSHGRYEPLRARTFQFAVDIVRYCRSLPCTWEARQVGEQLFRAGTAVGANYQSAGRSRSDREFIARLGVVVEESDESCFWLRLLIATNIKPGKDSERLLDETTELLRIFSASHRTAKENRNKRRMDAIKSESTTMTRLTSS